MTDPVLTQVAIHAFLDVVWPILPPTMWEMLAYV